VRYPAVHARSSPLIRAGHALGEEGGVMSESGTKGKAATVSKSGETGHELLRRTRQIMRRRFPAG